MKISIQLLFAGGAVVSTTHGAHDQQHQDGNYKVVDDMVLIANKDNDEDRTLFNQARNLAFQPSVDDRQADVWNKIKTMEDYKGGRIFTDNNGDGPTLSNFHYILQPIWWSDQNSADPSLKMDMSNTESVMERNLNYYRDMSWNKMDVTYNILAQQQLSVSSVNPSWSDTEAAARALIESQGYIEGVDFDGIILIYYVAQNGPFSGHGGWGNVNGPFTWMSFDTDFAVTRHEIGHNFGHPHHMSNSFGYRDSRPDVPPPPYDGFDMMSGGNGYAISDFAAASKWFFNWLPDSSIVHMQPEGATDECPTCVKSGTFTLFAFDDSSKPPSSSKVMGIHIPITVMGSRVYSYWLSYRVGNDAVKGLSVHVSWFDLGGIFGATYDSMNYDAFGNTDSTADSFVVEDTCYHISPAPYVKDRDILSVDAVQPVVCVDAINSGSDVTVSVEFLNPSNPPQKQVEVVEDLSLTCSESGSSLSSTIVDGSKYNLIHVTGTGGDGEVSLSMCPTTGSSDTVATAYFFDDYPTSPIMYGAPAAYGSFKSLSSSMLDCCQPGTVISADGGTVVKITNNRNDFLHLNEIEIYDGDGENVALNGKCYSRNSGWGGDADCLNDGQKGTYPTTCNSHSSWTDPGNYDFCVLPSVVDIKSIKVYPWVDPNRLWMTDRLRDLKVEVFAQVSDLSTIADNNNEGAVSTFYGLLASYPLSFTSSDYGPKEEQLSLLTEFTCPNTGSSQPPSFSYSSDYGNTWILVPPSETSSTASGLETTVSLTCSLSECGVNQYLDSAEGTCVQCPANQFAEAGSTSIADCTTCPAGTILAHPQATGCSLNSDYDEITSATGWRIWAPDYMTDAGWKWDVEELEFFDNVDCLGSPIDPSAGTAIDSANAGGGWGPENAFGSWIWGGRANSDGVFYLGKDFGSTTQVVRCIKLYQVTASGATEVRVQAYDDQEDGWVNAWIETDIDSTLAVNVIRLEYSSVTAAPNATPTSQPTKGPTDAPVETPIVSPSASPTALSTKSPISSPSCASLTNKQVCNQTYGCVFARKKCKVAPSDTKCRTFTKKRRCKRRGCIWQKNNKLCVGKWI